MKLNIKLLIPLLGTATLCFGLSTWISYTKAERAVLTPTLAAANMAASKASSEISAVLQGTQHTMQVIRGFPTVIQSLDPEATENAHQEARKAAVTVLKDAVTSLPNVQDIIIVNKEGMVIAASSSSVVGQSRTEKVYMKSIMAGENAFEGPITSLINGKPIFNLAVPVFAHGQVVGGVVGSVNLEVLSHTYIDPITIGSTGFIFVTTSTGLIIMHHSKDKILRENIGDFPWAQQALLQPKGVISYTSPGSTVGKTAAFITQPFTGWHVFATEDDSEIFSSVNELRNEVSVVALL